MLPPKHRVDYQNLLSAARVRRNIASYLSQESPRNGVPCISRASLMNRTSFAFAIGRLSIFVMSTRNWRPRGLFRKTRQSRIA